MLVTALPVRSFCRVSRWPNMILICVNLTQAIWRLDPSAAEARCDAATHRLRSPGIKLGVQPGSFFHTTECFYPVLGLMRAEDVDETIYSLGRHWQDRTAAHLEYKGRTTIPPTGNPWCGFPNARSGACGCTPARGVALENVCC
jgi:hypothetical protein